MTSFALSVGNFAGRAKRNIDKITRASAIELFSGVVKDTPVRDGYAKANWQITLTSPSARVTKDKDVSGQKTINKIKSKVENSDSNKFFLTNNLPYIYRLEYEGWSDQAPNGMVRINTSRWQSIVARNARVYAV